MLTVTTSALSRRLIHDGSIVYINELDAQIISKIKTGVILSEIRALLQMSGFPEKDPEKILPPRVKDEFRHQRSASVQIC